MLWREPRGGWGTNGMTFRKPPPRSSTFAATLWHLNTLQGLLGSYIGWKLSRRDGATLYFCTLLVQSRHLFYLFIFYLAGCLFLCAVDFPSNEDESGKTYKRRSWISVSSSGPGADFGPMFSMWKTRTWRGAVHALMKCIWVFFFNW